LVHACIQCGRTFPSDQRWGPIGPPCPRCHRGKLVVGEVILARSSPQDYLIERALGEGGTATVSLARHRQLRLPVAIKSLRRELAADPDIVAAFRHAAELTRAVSHANIVRVYNTGVFNGLNYMIMEYVDGLTLREVLLGSGRLGVQRTLDVAEKMAEALDHIWSTAHLVHNDIKPDNIMVTASHGVRLMDLGLARRAEEMPQEEDSFLGTPQYCAPEHILGRPLDFRSDMYSLGATLYHLLTGWFPFPADSSVEMLSQHLYQRLTPPHHRLPDVPLGLSVLIQGMLAKRPEHRYPSGGALLADIRRIRAGEPPSFELSPEAQNPIEQRRPGAAAAPPSPPATDNTTTSTVTKTVTTIVARVPAPEQAPAPDESEPPWWCRKVELPAAGVLFESLEGQDGFTIYRSLQARLQQNTIALVEIPENAARILNILGRPNFSYSELVALVKRSPSLTGEILKVANSTVYSRGLPIADLSLALPRIPLPVIKSMLLLDTSRTTLSTFPALHDILTGMVQHSLCVANTAMLLAGLYHPDANTAFVAGLLHDVGKIAVLLDIAERYKLPATKGAGLRESCFDEILPVMHEKAGGILAVHWNLSDEIRLAIEHHHDLYRLDLRKVGEQVLTLAAIINVSDAAARLLGRGRPLVTADFFALPGCRVLGWREDLATFEVLEQIPDCLARAEAAMG